MKKSSYTRSVVRHNPWLAVVPRLRDEGGFFNLRALIGFTLCFVGVALALFAHFSPVTDHLGLPSAAKASRPLPYMPAPGGRPEAEAADLTRLERYWNDRLTYPTGRFDPRWLRAAAVQHARLSVGVPAGAPATLNPRSPLTFTATSFTALGPQPEHMTGCTGCYDYVTTEGRVNSIAVDPTTTTNGSIVAYLGSVGGGVWKTTNCCSASTSWSVTTDDPLISTISIDSVIIDPNNHNTIYAGTGDLNFGSFSMGSQGILKSTNAGASWTLLGADVFVPGLPLPAGQFPQYQAVGKVRVDPRNSNNVVAGTKTGLYFSY